MLVLTLGNVEYGLAWRVQRRLAEWRVRGAVGDLLLLLEHPPTITLGRGARSRHLLATPETLAREGIAVLEVDRGGDVTYHGPGQLVGYPILDLRARGGDLHRYLRDVEEALILALAGLGVQAGRLPPHTGVWVDGAKVAAIGVKVSRWVSMHGFALNVNPPMAHFGLIVPCGIADLPVASLASILGAPPAMEAAAAAVKTAFGRVFGPSRPGAPCADSLRALLAELDGPLREVLEPALDAAEEVC